MFGSKNRTRNRRLFGCSHAEMNRGSFYNSSNTGAPFLLTGGEASEDPSSGMDCIQLRHHHTAHHHHHLQQPQPPGPFHYLISEQAKSLVALQELQHEVGALLEFRDLVIETFPSLRTKMASSSVVASSANINNGSNSGSPVHGGVATAMATSAATTTTSSPSNIPVRATSDWIPGVRVRKKVIKDGGGVGGGMSKKSETIQDSGFSTETSSKETHSAPSASSAPDDGDGGDELWNLLDLIHRKGTRLKDEVEALQGTIQIRQHHHHRHAHHNHQRSSDEESQGDDDDDGPEPGRDNNTFQRFLFTGSADDIRQLRQERDLLLDRLAEMEAEVMASRVHTSRLQEDLESLLNTRHDLEEQLKAVVSQRGTVNSRIHDLHSQFVASFNGGGGVNKSPDKVVVVSDNSPSRSAANTPVRRRTRTSSGGSGVVVVSGRKSGGDVDDLPKVKVPDSARFAAILKEHDALVLKKHLLVSTVENQVLHEQLDSAERVEIGLTDKLHKVREENDDLRFQLEDKNIELEGTRARVRLLEQLHHQPPPPASGASPDVIPTSVISTPSLNSTCATTKLDHTSSTESAHDAVLESSNSNSNTANTVRRRRPSRIPLKSYTAPKPPPGGAPRSRSGGGDARPHSAQSWRNGRGGGNHSGGVAKDFSLTKAGGGSTNSSLGGRGTLRKHQSGGGDNVMNSKVKQKSSTATTVMTTNEKSHYQWNLSLFGGTNPVNKILARSCHDNNNIPSPSYPDSLDRTVVRATTGKNTSPTDIARQQKFFLLSPLPKREEFYDSIDSSAANLSNVTTSNVTCSTASFCSSSSSFAILRNYQRQQRGVDLAECDSLDLSQPKFDKV